jgi:hypothetical protein
MELRVERLERGVLSIPSAITSEIGPKALNSCRNRVVPSPSSANSYRWFSVIPSPSIWLTLE